MTRRRADGTIGRREDPTVSKQAEWQRRMIAEGRCVTCGGGPVLKWGRCAVDVTKHRGAMAAYYQSKRVVA